MTDMIRTLATINTVKGIAAIQHDDETLELTALYADGTIELICGLMGFDNDGSPNLFLQGPWVTVEALADLDLETMQIVTSERWYEVQGKDAQGQWSQESVGTATWICATEEAADREIAKLKKCFGLPDDADTISGFDKQVYVDGQGGVYHLGQNDQPLKYGATEVVR